MSIELERVALRLGTVAALDGVSLTVADGEFLALIGPSGSGKTTLLRVIAGLERGFGGVVRISGQDVSSIPARARRIGFVFQNYALFRHMTVAENVAFGLRVRVRRDRPDRAAIRTRVAELLSLVQLADLGRRYPDQLSGGQRQRVALARALAIEPRVLLLDEPFGALDPPIRLGLRADLRDLHRRLGLTTVLVTHDREEAFELADRIAMLRAGRIEQVGTPEALDTTPANSFVFSFLGEGARLPGTVGNGCFHFAGLPLTPIASTVKPGPGTALVRPNEIAIAAGNGPGRVMSVRRGVQTTHYQVELAGRLIDAEAPGSPIAGLGIGDPCTVAVRFARIVREDAAGSDRPR